MERLARRYLLGNSEAFSNSTTIGAIYIRHWAIDRRNNSSERRIAV